MTEDMRKGVNFAMECVRRGKMLSQDEGSSLFDEINRLSRLVYKLEKSIVKMHREDKS